MSFLQSNLGGPLAIAAQFAGNAEQGVELTLHEETFSRGSVVEFFKPGLIASIPEVQANSLDDLNGGFGHAGLLEDVTDGFAAIVTARNDTPPGFKAPIVVQGEVHVSVFFEDNAGDSVAITERDTIYLVEDQQYVTTNAALTGATVGRPCGVVLESIPAGARPEGAPSLVRCLFNGIPAFLG